MSTVKTQILVSAKYQGQEISSDLLISEDGDLGIILNHFVMFLKSPGHQAMFYHNNP